MGYVQPVGPVLIMELYGYSPERCVYRKFRMIMLYGEVLQLSKPLRIYAVHLGSEPRGSRRFPALGDDSEILRKAVH
jgi:hypothetical protein